MKTSSLLSSGIALTLLAVSISTSVVRIWRFVVGNKGMVSDVINDFHALSTIDSGCDGVFDPFGEEGGWPCVGPAKDFQGASQDR
jgi:hypothetical protein